MEMRAPLCGRSCQRSQNGDLGIRLDRAEAVLGQPADHNERSPGPPCADEVAVDIGAVACEDVVKVLFMRKREGGKVE
jgi:hypothetical protein